ncbi:hypothetical protein [Kordiimonas sp.]|uniref:hypothetical protein n=1 Tax=Kordiimonas sp. TaxID=1970157 RepID=UPI003A8D5155
MSTQSLATGDTIYFVRASGGGMGRSVTYSRDESIGDGLPVDCLVQETTSKESGILDAAGLAFGYEIFFSSDPGIAGVENDLSVFWKDRDDGSRPTGTYELTDENGETATGLRIDVVGSFSEGRPGETLLWVVVAATADQKRGGT